MSVEQRSETVLALSLAGYTNQQIAAMLGISVRTVYRKRAFIRGDQWDDVHGELDQEYNPLAPPEPQQVMQGYAIDTIQRAEASISRLLALGRDDKISLRDRVALERGCGQIWCQTMTTLRRIGYFGNPSRQAGLENGRMRTRQAMAHLNALKQEHADLMQSMIALATAGTPGSPGTPDTPGTPGTPGNVPGYGHVRGSVAGRDAQADERSVQNEDHEREHAASPRQDANHQEARHDIQRKPVAATRNRLQAGGGVAVALAADHAGVSLSPASSAHELLESVVNAGDPLREHRAIPNRAQRRIEKQRRRRQRRK